MCRQRHTGRMPYNYEDRDWSYAVVQLQAKDWQTLLENHQKLGEKLGRILSCSFQSKYGPVDTLIMNF